MSTGVRPSLTELAQADQEDRGTERVAAEVDAMLDLFDSSPLAATLRRPDTCASYFYFGCVAADAVLLGLERSPVEGAPVHGTIDAFAAKCSGAWHVIDFKTDEARQDALD